MLSDKLLVSVVIPVYNVEDYLRTALDSIVNQTYNNLEILIVNDGSDDSSPEICSEYQEKYDNIKLINQENKGVSGARNTGLKNCTGDYVYFFDSDDILQLDAISTLVGFAVEKKMDIIMFEAEIFGQIDNMDKDKYKQNLLDSLKMYSTDQLLNTVEHLCSPVWLYFYSTEFLKDNGLFFYEGIIHEDELFTSLVLMNIDNIGFISKSFFKRRYRENSIMTSSGNKSKHSTGYFTVARVLGEFYHNNEINLSEAKKKYLKKVIEKCIVYTNVVGDYSISQTLKFNSSIGINTSTRVYSRIIYNRIKILKQGVKNSISNKDWKIYFLK